MVCCDDLSKCASYLLLYGSCSGDHCNRAFLLLSFCPVSTPSGWEPGSRSPTKLDLSDVSRSRFASAPVKPTQLHLCMFIIICPLCLCVCVSTRNAIGKRRGGSVGLWCNSPPLVDTAHTDIRGFLLQSGSTSFRHLRTNTCNLNALIVGVAPLEMTDYYYCIVVNSAIAFLASMAESSRHSAAAHISGRGTAIKLPIVGLSFAKCRLYLFLT